MSTPENNLAESVRPKLALIAGPTASGKSALALELAERANGVIINADASQVYADLAVLSARPSVEEMARAPHRLFGFMDGAEACSAARWASETKREIKAAHETDKLPILVGGTGLYIRTLLDGIAPVPEIDAEIRAAVRALPVDQAYAALIKEDAPAAARLKPPADVPLKEMFGYIGQLRALSSGRAQFTMQFDHYAVAIAEVKTQSMHV